MTTSPNGRHSGERAGNIDSSARLNKVAQAYGTAFFEYIHGLQTGAAATSLFEDVRSSLDEIVRILFGNAQLKNVLNSPVLPTEKKIKLVEELFKLGKSQSSDQNDQTELHALALHFIFLLLKRKRLEHLPAILSVFDTLKDESQGIRRGLVRTAHEISQDELRDLEKSFGKRFGHQVILSSEIDPQLMGGLVVQVGDLTFDGSVRSSLKRLETALERI